MIDRFTTELAALSAEGGWVLWGLVALAFGIAFALLSIWHSLQFRDAPLFSKTEWQQLLKSGAVSQESRAVFCENNAQSEELYQQLFSKPKRRIPFAFVLIGAAPLVGLLGTVSGMFTTFDGLAGAAASAPVDVISRGVSEALITTQAGLIIGVPSFIVCTLLKSKFDRLRFGFQRLEIALIRER